MSYKTHQKTGYHGKHHRLQTHILKSKGQKLGKRKFPIEMWVGLQISAEKICIIGKKSVGPKNAEEKNGNSWKKIGGWVPNRPRNKFSAYVPQIFA